MSPREAAAAAVARAVRSGQIPPASMMTCEACREPARDWHHHHGYDEVHRLDVTALCRACHSQVHVGVIREPRTGLLRTPDPKRLDGRGIPGPRSMVAEITGSTPRRAPPKGTKVPDRWEWAFAWVKANPPPPRDPDGSWTTWAQQYLTSVPTRWSEVTEPVEPGLVVA